MGDKNRDQILNDTPPFGHSASNERSTSFTQAVSDGKLPKEKSFNIRSSDQKLPKSLKISQYLSSHEVFDSPSDRNEKGTKFNKPLVIKPMPNTKLSAILSTTHKTQLTKMIDSQQASRKLIQERPSGSRHHASE
jgi:hypothetical protein